MPVKFQCKYQLISTISIIHNNTNLQIVVLLWRYRYPAIDCMGFIYCEVRHVMPTNRSSEAYIITMALITRTTWHDGSLLLGLRVFIASYCDRIGNSHWCVAGCLGLLVIGRHTTAMVLVLWCVPPPPTPPPTTTTTPASNVSWKIPITLATGLGNRICTCIYEDWIT